jgi:hypothetical protein
MELGGRCVFDPFGASYGVVLPPPVRSAITKQSGKKQKKMEVK